MPLTLAEAKRFSLLEVTTILELSQPTVLRLTNAAGGLEIDGDVYLSEPTLEFQLPEYSGAIEVDDAARVRFADQYQFFRDIIGGRAAPRTVVRLREVAFDPETLAATSLLTLWAGDLEFGEINPEGKPGLVELRVSRCGGKIDRELGPEVSDLCWKRFGDPKNCGVDVEALAQATQVTAINRNRVTIVDPLVTGQVNFYWQQGSISRGDVRINIRLWESGTSFVLSENPPQEWVDSLVTAPPLAVTLRPGCRKILADCNRYNNTAEFGGLGIRIPARNILFELP